MAIDTQGGGDTGRDQLTQPTRLSLKHHTRAYSCKTLRNQYRGTLCDAAKHAGMRIIANIRVVDDGDDDDDDDEDVEDPDRLQVGTSPSI